MLFIRTFNFLLVAKSCSGFFLNFGKLGEDLEKYNLEFLKDYLKFPVYIDPHPKCALEDERCTIDTDCCGGFECKMAVDGEGVKYTCQERVGVNKSELVTGEEGEEWEKEWEEESEDNSLLGEIYKARLAEIAEEERKLINDQYRMIKELQRPLSLEEMRELQQIKEIEDYKRENELKELREWRESKKKEEAEKRETENKLREIAVERVAKVLKEEEKQKLAIFKEIQDEMKKKRSWF